MDYINRFSKRLYFTNENSLVVQNLLAKIDEAKGYWLAFESLSPDFLNTLQRTVIVSSTGSSTRIEGSNLSDEVVEKLLREAKIRKLSTRDEQEVAGYLELIKNVFDAYQNIAISESTIKQFHQILLGYSEKDEKHKGKYKFGPNRVEAIDHKGNVVGVIFDPTPPYLVEKEMGELVEWTNTELEKRAFHPLLVISNFIYEYLAIHPFQDGNGRSSRILTNLLLLKSGYDFAKYVSHEKIVEDLKIEYYLALKKSTTTWKTETENIFPFVEFFLSVVAKQGEMAVALTKEDKVELSLAPQQLKVWDLFKNNKEYSRSEIATDLGLSVKTVDKAIIRLLELNKIQKIGRGRAIKYVDKRAL
jgi:Fic family protein